MDRRAFLAMVAASGALLARPGAAMGGAPGVALGPPRPFSPADVVARARAIAARPFIAPPVITGPWAELDYDQYRDIRFRPSAAPWRDGRHPFGIQFFAPGFYFREPVSVSLVEDGLARPLKFDQAAFDTGPLVPELPDGPALGYSGFRLHGAINRGDRRDEFAVFQGASYFRAVGRGQVYGQSARGLAVNTAEPEGEEFPAFRAFWVETPEAGAENVRIHALLDSPSVAGAYQFDVAPGEATTFDIEAVLFPRSTLGHVGIAPLTSMFLYDATNRSRFDDFRPAVHDTNGLMVLNGAGEQLWRPLANPSRLQVSQFLDHNPRGFGLVQRARALGGFADLEARYEKRPSTWVEPGGGWGRGSVALVEIPTDREINDNIVAYWRPSRPLEEGGEHRIAYRLEWCWSPREVKQVARVAGTAMGARGGSGGSGRLVVIDFEAGPGAAPDPAGVVADMVVRPGGASPGVIQRNPETGGLRLAFAFDPAGADIVELRAQLRDRDRRPLTEVWLYRWTS